MCHTWGTSGPDSGLMEKSMGPEKVSIQILVHNNLNIPIEKMTYSHQDWSNEIKTFSILFRCNIPKALGGHGEILGDDLEIRVFDFFSRLNIFS